MIIRVSHELLTFVGSSHDGVACPCRSANFRSSPLQYNFADDYLASLRTPCSDVVVTSHQNPCPYVAELIDENVILGSVGNASAFRDGRAVDESLETAFDDETIESGPDNGHPHLVHHRNYSALMKATAVSRNLGHQASLTNVVCAYLGAGNLHSWIDRDAAEASPVKGSHDARGALGDGAWRGQPLHAATTADPSPRQTGPSYLR